MGSETVRDFFVLEAALVNGRRGVVQNLKDKYSTKLQQARTNFETIFHKRFERQIRRDSLTC